MLIKDIKAAYKDYFSKAGHNTFVVYDWNAYAKYDDYFAKVGKAVVVVHIEKVCGDIWRDVVQVVRVSDGKKLLEDGRCRPCDNLNDAIDVATEMLTNDNEIEL